MLLPAPLTPCDIALWSDPKVGRDQLAAVDEAFYSIPHSCTRTNVGLDIFNILNSNPVLTYDQSYSPTSDRWLRPTSVLQPRYVKVSAQLSF